MSSPIIAIKGYERALGELSTALNSTGIPYDGISIEPTTASNETAQLRSANACGAVAIRHAPITTEVQRATLENVLKNFTFVRRTRKAREAIRADVKKLNNPDRADLIDEALAYLIETDPEFALRVGKMIDGDQAPPRGAQAR